jgi:rhodanese-related sulfurtransferase
MSKPSYHEITPDDAYRARGKARLIDVREVGELALDGFIPGVEHVPLATVEAQAWTWSKDDELVMVCRSGARSGRAAAVLAAMGFRRVMNMTGGMIAYRAAGLPVAHS